MFKICFALASAQLWQKIWYQEMFEKQKSLDILLMFSLTFFMKKFFFHPWYPFELTSSNWQLPSIRRNIFSNSLRNEEHIFAEKCFNPPFCLSSICHMFSCFLNYKCRISLFDFL